MNRCTDILAKFVKDRRSELTALLVSLLFSSVFLMSFALGYEPVSPKAEIVIWYGPSPATAVHVDATQAVPEDPNEKFRVVPENFAHVDFKNWRYGRYRFWGSKLDLTLAEGEYVYPSKEGGGGETFFLTDVLYTDVTGDGKVEAIVLLSHVQCGGSCDGGSDLFYVYQSSKSGLRQIWEYETGSRAYGCGLKSLTVSKKQLALEMFGQCWQPASSFGLSGKFVVRDVTRSVFHFNGSRFVKRLTEVTAAPATDLRNYTPQIHINDNGPNAGQKPYERIAHSVQVG